MLVQIDTRFHVIVLTWSRDCNVTARVFGQSTQLKIAEGGNFQLGSISNLLQRIKLPLIAKLQYMLVFQFTQFDLVSDLTGLT